MFHLAPISSNSSDLLTSHGCVGLGVVGLCDGDCVGDTDGSIVGDGVGLLVGSRDSREDGFLIDKP